MFAVVRCMLGPGGGSEPPPVVRCEREEGLELPSWPPDRPLVLFVSTLCAIAVPYAMLVVHLVVAAAIWHTMICACPCESVRAEIGTALKSVDDGIRHRRTPSLPYWGQGWQRRDDEYSYPKKSYWYPKKSSTLNPKKGTTSQGSVGRSYHWPVLLGFWSDGLRNKI